MQFFYSGQGECNHVAYASMSSFRQHEARKIFLHISLQPLQNVEAYVILRYLLKSGVINYHCDVIVLSLGKKGKLVKELIRTYTV